VGGDYYDFLNLGAGRLGIVLADIAGKGIPGALLMANLQADVRSQCAIASQNLRQFLKSVNQSFFESTDEGSYATLFFGDYQDSTRQLRYANCGHNPPLLVHANGTAERLTATATVLGLFEEWESSLADVRITSGDVLVSMRMASPRPAIPRAKSLARAGFSKQSAAISLCRFLAFSMRSSRPHSSSAEVRGR
jgi:serine phosphatase RsbU (regulator of sigma subunit)